MRINNDKLYLEMYVSRRWRWRWRLSRGRTSRGGRTILVYAGPLFFQIALPPEVST